MTAACCCTGSGEIGTCPEWVNCRPQEIWISYSYFANYKRIVMPEFGATGLGGILVEETESCSGNIRFIKRSGAVTGCGGTVSNPMLDYRGNFSYSKIREEKRPYDSNDSAAGLCPDDCTQCVRLVPYRREQTNASLTWDNTGNLGLHGENGNIICFRCIASGGSGILGGPRSAMTIFQKADFSTSTILYRCNGTQQSSSSSVLPNRFAAFSAIGRPQCLNSSAFGDYYGVRDVVACGLNTSTAVLPITYPTCRVIPDPCDSNANPLYYSGESINDCYSPYCFQRSCYNPFPILSGGCGCSNIPNCDNPFPSGFPNNSCAEVHEEYTMSSSVTVANVIP